MDEETGLEPTALYNVTVNSFYLHAKRTIQMCIVFAAFVADDAEVMLGEEHQRSEWLSVDDACERFTWPREAHSLRDAQAPCYRRRGAGGRCAPDSLTQASPRHRLPLMRFIRSQSTVLHTLILMAVPIVLSGCGIIAGACHDERFVGVAGTIIEGGTEVVALRPISTLTGACSPD